MTYPRSQEETLNHVFDLTLAIAGIEVVRHLLFKPLGLDGKRFLTPTPTPMDRTETGQNDWLT